MTNLNAYRVPPQCERKAARELRENGIKAYVPVEVVNGRRAPVARGYVFSAHKHAFAKHVRSCVGAVASADLGRLYLARTRRQSEVAVPFAIGQSVYAGEIPATITDSRGRSCIITWTMLGKDHSRALHYSQLRPG